MMEFTLRQYRAHQKAEFLRGYLREAKAAAKLLGDELTRLRFHFATIGQAGDGSRSARIEFRGVDCEVWVDAKGDDAVKVLAITPEGTFSLPHSW